MAILSQMTFRRYGRSLHLRIGTADELAHVLDLDEAHWVATGAPIGTLACDPVLLTLLDTDHNRRILCHELRQAVRWLLTVLADTSGVTERSDTLRLSAINADDPDGRRAKTAAEKMLARLNAGEADAITLEQVRGIKAEVEATPVSEAGVVLPQAADNAEVRRFIEDVRATVGGTDHPSGEPGIGQAQLDAFLADARAQLDWLARAEGDEAAAILPLGDRTAAAFALYADLRGKIDQYFLQCTAVEFDARAAERIGIGPERLAATDFSDPAAVEELMRDSPLASPRADRTLLLQAEINPHYAERLERLRAEAISPVLGGPVESLSESDWAKVKAYFAAHEAWLAAEPGRRVAPLGAETLRRYLDDRYRASVMDLIADSAKTAFDLDNIRLTEKLILYQANLIEFANNFVSFPHLYDPGSRATFEMGTLVADGRRFNFAVRVDNRAEHAAVARTGNMFVLYAEVLPPEGERYEVALPVTSGGKGNLCVGKRGVFQDVAGREIDARIVQIIENPISVREALASPFQKIGRLLTGKIESIASKAEQKFDTQATTTVDQMGKPAEPAQAAQPSGMAAGGLLMGGAVAVSALGATLAYATKSLADVNRWKIVLALGVAVLAVIVPITIVALLKLRRRDLSAILEGAGWAINARMRLTFRQGRYFTQRPRYPLGAVGLSRRWRWLLWLLVFAAVGGGAAVLLWWLATRG